MVEYGLRNLAWVADDGLRMKEGLEDLPGLRVEEGLGGCCFGGSK